MTDWKRKLAAFLHDPPSKALDIATHGERSDSAFRAAGFTEESDIGEYFKLADYTGAAADRLPFPNSQASGLRCAFDGIRNAFLHPLDGSRLPFHAEFKSAEQGFEGEASVQPVLTAESLAALSDDNLRWRARFFTHWRLWPKHAIEKDYRLGLLPADTRIPDHSIWTHMQVVSALDGCIGSDKVWQPAFLKFQLGPVQDFIAAARSVRDLWSGSYLLSWLMAAGMKVLSAEVGPDAIVFPSLRGQPLFDLHWRKELWDKVKIGDQTVWQSLAWQNRDLLTPNLPNVFLAVVAADHAADLGRKVADAIQAEWKRIAGAVWAECEKAGLTPDEGGISAEDRKIRFDAQIARFLSVSWQATSWPKELEDALKLADGFDSEMPIRKARERVQAVVEMATERMPFDHRDWRYYTDESKTTLNNVGLGWSVILAFNSWALDAVRQTRDFTAANAGGWQSGTFNNKDALTGRDEAVAGGDEWSRRSNTAAGFWPALFKKGDWLCASTLVKRVWHRAYLETEWKLDTRSKAFPMPNTRGIAGHEPEEDCRDDETAEDATPSEKYFAVLAFDGDEIGKWVSGEKTPSFSSQLADYKDGSNVQRLGSKPYFEKPEFKDFLKAQRPLSPSYHLQFSEALSNFALLCARPIVEAFDGRLIYAGGDDVVALLPSDTALACAEGLRLAFAGSQRVKEFLQQHALPLRQRHECEQQRNPKAALVPYYQKLATEGCLLDCPAPGFVRRLDQVDQQDHPIPFLVPGPAADASVGIAIAHFKSPLQDVVRAAQLAEKRAKDRKKLGRSAVAITLFKRSGETIEWGCKWDGGGLGLYRAIADALDAGQLSAKFPHRIAELLSAYVTDTTSLVKEAETVQSVTDFRADDVIRQEFKHTLGRQRGPAFASDKDTREELLGSLNRALEAYLDSLKGRTGEEQLRALIGLCQTVAFAHRTRDNDSPSAASASSVVATSAERQAP